MRSLRWAVLFLVTSPAFAGSLDGLMEVAQAAMARGDYATAVANLRRARQSTLAEGKDAELLTALHAAESKWLLERSAKLRSEGLDARFSKLRGLYVEAARLDNPAARAAIEQELDDVAMALLQRDGSIDDASTLALGATLQNAAPSSTRLKKAVSDRESAVRSKIAKFSLGSVDAEYTRNKIAYYYRLLDTPPSDPHPLELGLDVDGPAPAWQASGDQELSRALLQQLQKTRGSTKVQVVLTSLSGSFARRSGTSRKSLPYTVKYKVTDQERVVVKRTQQVPHQVTTQTCYPTYTPTTRTVTRDGSTSTVTQGYMQSGQNCYGNTSTTYTTEEYETEEYVSKTRDATRTENEVVPVDTRETTLSYGVRGILRIGDTDVEFTLNDKVSLQEESYRSAHSSSASFARESVSEQSLRTSAVSKIEGEVLRLANRAAHTARAAELRTALAQAAAGSDQDRIEAELYTLEGAPSAGFIGRIAQATDIPLSVITAALSGGRMNTRPALEAPSVVALQLPAPDANAEKDAFEAEARDYVDKYMQERGASGFLGAGSAQFPSGPAFPYFNLGFGLNTTPSFLLFRNVTGSAFMDANLGIGHMFAINAVGGLTAGIRVGPLALSAVGVVGADTIYVDKDDREASDNEPYVPGAPLLGYGARLSLKTEPLNVVATARRHHRFLAGPSLSYVADLRIGSGWLYVMARYETFRDILSNDTSRTPWSAAGGIGIHFDFADTTAESVKGK